MLEVLSQRYAKIQQGEWIRATRLDEGIIKAQWSKATSWVFREGIRARSRKVSSVWTGWRKSGDEGQEPTAAFVGPAAFQAFIWKVKEAWVEGRENRRAAFHEYLCRVGSVVSWGALDRLLTVWMFFLSHVLPIVGVPSEQKSRADLGKTFGGPVHWKGDCAPPHWNSKFKQITNNYMGVHHSSVFPPMVTILKLLLKY